MRILDRLKQVRKNLKRELAVYQLVLKDERTPRPAKFLLGFAIGYVLMPFDLIPDFLPVIGQLDDLIIVPGLIICALKIIPSFVVDDCRRQILQGDNEN